MEVAPFVLDRVFNKTDDVEGNIVYWAPVIGGGEGYIILWDNGDYHHTYHYPPDFI